MKIVVSFILLLIAYCNGCQDIAERCTCIFDQLVCAQPIYDVILLDPFFTIKNANIRYLELCVTNETTFSFLQNLKHQERTDM